MLDFRCLGAECEDHCCKDWSILVDQGHYGKIRKVLDRSADTRELWTRAVVLEQKESRGRDRFARIHLAQDGLCPFLGGDRLCSLQRLHGEEILPDTCSMYPRVLLDIKAGEEGGQKARRELGGTLSCPEVARRALLFPDALDLVAAQEASQGRGITASDAHLCGYGDHGDLLRGMFSGLSENKSLPLASALYVCADVAFRLDRLFAEPTSDIAEFQALILAMDDDNHLRTLLESLPQGSPPGSALAFLLGILGTRVDPQQSAFHRIVYEAMESYVQDPSAGVTLEPQGQSTYLLQADPELLGRAYLRTLDQTSAPCLARVDEILRRYCRHFWLREGPTDLHSLFPHTLGLVVRVLLLRFLILSQPDKQNIDKVAVRVIYSYSRIQEHNENFATSLRGMLGKVVAEGRGMPLVRLLLASKVFG